VKLTTKIKLVTRIRKFGGINEFLFMPSYLKQRPSLEFFSEINFLAVQMFEAFVLLGCYTA
jgi:hypothetical protein